MRCRVRELIVSITVLDDLAIPLLYPADHGVSWTALKLALNAEPLDDHVLSIDPVDPCIRESE